MLDPGIEGSSFSLWLATCQVVRERVCEVFSDGVPDTEIEASCMASADSSLYCASPELGATAYQKLQQGDVNGLSLPEELLLTTSLEVWGLDPYLFGLSGVHWNLSSEILSLRAQLVAEVSKVYDEEEDVDNDKLQMSGIYTRGKSGRGYNHQGCYEWCIDYCRKKHRVDFSCVTYCMENRCTYRPSEPAENWLSDKYGSQWKERVEGDLSKLVQAIAFDAETQEFYTVLVSPSDESLDAELIMIGQDFHGSYQNLFFTPEAIEAISDGLRSGGLLALVFGGALLYGLGSSAAVVYFFLLSLKDYFEPPADEPMFAEAMTEQLNAIF
ncbi:MAG: hypothetical protein IPJ88_11695 [Myxococcales bacterium]|nr:MAG: hypothetical protein IPJ88_11695 [Myxococcales bacterium]